MRSDSFIQHSLNTAQLVKDPPEMQEILGQFLSWEDCWRKDRLPTSVFLGLSCGSVGKESACNAGDLGMIPGLGRSPGGGKGYPLIWGPKESDTTERLSGLNGWENTHMGMVSQL